MRESPGRLRASTFLRRRRNRLGLNIGCVDWIRENPARAGSNGRSGVSGKDAANHIGRFGAPFLFVSAKK